MGDGLKIMDCLDSGFRVVVSMWTLEKALRPMSVGTTADVPGGP